MISWKVTGKQLYGLSGTRLIIIRFCLDNPLLCLELGLYENTFARARPKAVCKILLLARRTRPKG